MRGQTYWFAVAAVNAEGFESVPCGELSATANAGPKAAPDVIDAVPNRTSRVPVAFLLRNDTDPDGDELQLDSIDAVTQAGGTTAVSDGLLYYTPPAGFQGLDGLVYRISDGHGHSASANISVRVQPPTKPHIAPVASLPEQGGSVLVQFKAAPNLRFAVEASSDLVTWSSVGAAVSDEHGDVSFVDVQPSSPSRFYRLSLP